MSRNARRREPYVPGKERLEVSQEHMTLRLLGLGAALLVAALAFGYAINNMLQAPAGWQTVEAGSSKTGITQYFTLNYNFGAAGGNATKERKAVSAIYTQSLDHAYRVLSNLEDSQDAGLAARNASPNREIAVDVQVLAPAQQTVNVTLEAAAENGRDFSAVKAALEQAKKQQEEAERLKRITLTFGLGSARFLPI